MTATPKQILVQFLDPEGKCRAWAKGPADRLAEVLERAEKELDAYRAEKREVGDPLAEAQFVSHIGEFTP